MTLSSNQKSTIVRPRKREYALRAAFASLERTAPDVGARIAERLWFTVPSGGAIRSPQGGRPFEVRTRGRELRGWIWGSGPTVYLVHGWGGHAGQLASFVRPLVTAGFTVVAHDAPSHGASGPGHAGRGSSDIIEFAQSLDAVAAEHGPAHAVIGHSMGAMAAVLAMQHGWLGAERLVMIAPMVDVRDAFPVFGARLGLGERTLRRLARRVERRVAMPLDSFDLAALAPRLQPTSLLAVHDRDDRETPYTTTEALVARWPDAELLTTHGLGHRRILRDPDVVRTVTSSLVADAARRLPQPA
jgi:alpha-beta hydrolase superfamily lysophospholipase